MAQMGGSRHLKRLAVVGVKVPKKGKKWITKPLPGPHPIGRCVPLGVLLRDYLGFAKTMREASKILAERKILVDGRVRTNKKFPVGFMDVVSIPSIGQHYRALLDHLGRIVLHPIPSEESSFKLCRVEKKTTIKNGRIQLSLHDGRTVLFDGNVKVGDVLQISLPDQKVLRRLPCQPGSVAMGIGGKTMGKVGKIVEIREIRGHGKLVVLESGEGTIQTTVDKIFVIGEEEPLISLHEPNA